MKGRSIFYLAACMAFVGLLSVPANAENAWYNCNVTQTGPSGTEVRVLLTDSAATPAFTSKWFKAPQGQENRMLAVAMAALTGKKKVAALVDPAADGTPEIAALYLKQ
jgi:hypothetical protein